MITQSTAALEFVHHFHDVLQDAVVARRRAAFSAIVGSACRSHPPTDAGHARSPSACTPPAVSIVNGGARSMLHSLVRPSSRRHRQ